MTDKRYSNPITALDRPWGFQEFEAPTFQDNQHMKVVRLSALCSGILNPLEIFLVLISVKRSSCHQGHSAARRMSMKNSNDTIRNRTHNLPACSAVPWQTAPSCAPYQWQISENKYEALMGCIISLLSVIHTIHSIIQTNLHGLHVSTIYGHFQTLFLN